MNSCAAKATGPCPAGQYNDTTGQRPCSLCPIGTYSFNASYCKPCPPGQSTESVGSLSLSDCSLNATNPLFYFLKISNFYQMNSNAAGYFIEAVDYKTPAQCAQLCINDPGCLSFDSGVVGNFQEGDCFLSYDNRKTNDASKFLSVSQLNYYEKINGGMLPSVILSLVC
jgi:hypothetical protein